MKLYKSIKKRYDRLSKVRFDKGTGFYFYVREGHKVYIRHPKHYMSRKDYQWVCENIYYKHYLPQKGDQVVNLGVNYGEEAVYIKARSPGVKFLGVEPQPIIYECVSNTFRALGDNFHVSPFLISKEETVKFTSQFGHLNVGIVSQGYIEIPTLNWPAFVKRYGLEKIDFLQMNIEGAEKDLIGSINDFSIIQRLLISCHDFRANNGDGEFFRTKKNVTGMLEENGYTITNFNFGIEFCDDWIFASKE